MFTIQGSFVAHPQLFQKGPQRNRQTEIAVDRLDAQVESAVDLNHVPSFDPLGLQKSKVVIEALGECQKQRREEEAIDQEPGDLQCRNVNFADQGFLFVFGNKALPGFDLFFNLLVVGIGAVFLVSVLFQIVFLIV